MTPQSVSFKALLLDFDGVVLESTDIKTQAFIEMFHEFPQHLDAIAQYHEKHVGMSRYKKLSWIYRELLNKPLSKEMSRALGHRFSEIVFEKIMKTPFVPGARETLVTCSSLGIPVFIISGTPHEELQEIIHLREIGGYITESWGSPTEKTVAIRNIKDAYGIDTSEMLLIGDGYFDYQAARSENVAFLARKCGANADQWDQQGIPNVPDLRSLALVAPKRSVTIAPKNKTTPILQLSLK